MELFLESDREIRTFEDLYKLRKFMTTNLALRNIITGLLFTEQEGVSVIRTIDKN